MNGTRVLIAFLFCLFPVFSQISRLAINAGWDPVTEAERSLAKPVVDPQAGAEALFWRVHVVDELAGGSDPQRHVYHYIRLKIFNDAGKESASTISLQYREDEVITGVAGRTIRPDGSIVDLKSDAVHEREMVRVGRLRVRAKSFAMPAVEPGAIVEYRWRQTQNKPRFRYARLQFQREFPVQKVTYYFVPLSHAMVQMPHLSILPFNCKPTPLDLDKRGFNVTSVENMPAFRPEPMMPSEASVRSWALLFYHEDKRDNPEAFWNKTGKENYSELKKRIKLSDVVKAATAESLQGAKEEEKLDAMLRYVRRNMRGLWDPAVTDAERAAVIKSLQKSEGRSLEEILKSRIALPSEMNTLFAAMATQAGFEVRPAMVADRDDIPFHPKMLDEYFLPNLDVAIRGGDGWHVYDVTARHLPPDMLSWREQGVLALLADPKKPEFILSNFSPPEASETKRTARLELSQDGSLKGTVEERYGGHPGAELRADLDGESAEARQEFVKKQVLRVFPNAAVTGKRLFFAPLYFQRGNSPRFPAAERRYDVSFPYAWREVDEVTIQLPEGFELDNAESPGGLELGQTGSYGLLMQMRQNNELRSVRTLIFGRNGGLLFPKDSYSALKQAFDEIHRRDSQVLAVKRP